MTKKHFERLAAILKNEVELAGELRIAQDEVFDHLDNVGRAIATFAQEENPRFDRDRFLRAAGLTK